MKPLPDLDDVTAMAATGRRSVLMRARNEACEALRDACTRCQAADVSEAGEPSKQAIDAAQRLIEVASLWRVVNNMPDESLVPLLEASIAAVKAKKCAPSTNS